jgi:hypothetical protein
MVLVQHMQKVLKRDSDPAEIEVIVGDKIQQAISLIIGSVHNISLL